MLSKIQLLLIIIYLLFTITDCNNDEKGGSSSQEGDNNLTTVYSADRKLLKRHDLDFPTCIDSFDIHQDKIIRTQDSRSMGAKYLNERDVPTREDCLRICCETPDCDVFVFEEKNPGSCYLFECGAPEDFKCKFTKHSNYTSAVLAINRHMTELESQIKLTQHEHELTKLRKPEVTGENVVIAVSVAETTTSLPHGSKEVAQIVPTSPNSETAHQDRHCSRYQFECRSSGECIAIYNACDGIPQCSDGSDEAFELGCPVTATTQQPVIKTNHAVGESINLIATSHKPMASLSGHGTGPQSHASQQLTSTAVLDDLAVPVLSKQYKGNQWAPQMYNQESHMNNIGNTYVSNTRQQGMIPSPLNQQVQPQQTSSDFQQPPQQLVNQAKIYGREGEGLLYHPNELVQWPQSYPQEQSNVVPYHPTNNGNSQIFSHKGNGLVSQSDRYRHVGAHMNINNVVKGGGGGVLNQYEPVQNDYNRYNNYYENSPYRMMQQNAWQQVMHKPHEVNAVPNTMEENMNIPIQNIVQNQVSAASGPADYYYEENYRTRMQPQNVAQRIPVQNNPAGPKVKQSSHNTESPNEESIMNSDSSSNSVKKPAAHHSTNITPTSKPKDVQHEHQVQHHTSHRKMEQLTAEVTLRESTFDTELDGQNGNPSGAILSLTLGMCVTGIMLVLVGCRMRMVRRRMRRGSKSPYAHDADFLVNGMYL